MAMDAVYFIASFHYVSYLFTDKYFLFKIQFSPNNRPQTRKFRHKNKDRIIFIKQSKLDHLSFNSLASSSITPSNLLIQIHLLKELINNIFSNPIIFNKSTHTFPHRILCFKYLSQFMFSCRHWSR